MNKNVLIVLLLVIVVGVSFVAGVRVGLNRGIAASFNQDVFGAATELGARVKTLEMIKQGKIDKAQEYIEKFVDNDLGYLGVITQNKLLKDKKQVFEAIQLAKAYRDKYPGHPIHPTLNRGVENAFKQVEK